MLEAADWSILALSLKVAVVAVLGALPPACALAWLLSRVRFPGKVLLDGLVHLPLVTPPVVVGWLLLGLFGPAAPMGRWLETVFGLELMFRWTGAALAAGVMALPLMVRAMRLSFDGVDRRLEAAARSLGAGPFRVFWTVSAPLAAPGVLAALVLGFARALGEFGATIAFVSNIPGETRTLSLAIYNALQTPGGEDSAARLAGLSILLSLAALVASEAMIRKGRRNEA
jgi:molybdate transport system permease protein